MTIRDELERLEASGLEREVVDTVPVGEGRVLFDGSEYIDFGSNDYLGLANDPELTGHFAENVRRYGVGSGAARLLSGSRPPASRFEEKFAELTGKASALLFNSGYHANLGIASAVTTEGSLIFSDEYNHASIVDGCRLSRADVVVYPHLDMDGLEALLRQAEDRGDLRRDAPHLLVTEGVFSMDGDLPDIERLLYLKERFGLLLYVDDAHGFGVLGPRARGAFDACLESVDIFVATLGKAAGVFGAAVGASEEIVRLLRSRARPFIFSTSLPPAVVATADMALYLISGRRGERLRRRLHENAAFFRQSLVDAGLSIGRSASHIGPVILGDERRALKASVALLQEGIFCRPIRYPTVALGQARLRFSLSAGHRREDLEHTLAHVTRICREEGVENR